MQTILKVDGMACSHCENTIKKALFSLSGVTNVEINLSEKTVKVEYDNIEIETIKNEIEEQGYDVISK